MSDLEVQHTLRMDVQDAVLGSVRGEIVMLSHERVSLRFPLHRAPTLPLARSLSLAITADGGHLVPAAAIVTRRMEFEDGRQYEFEFEDPNRVWSQVGLDALLAANLRPHSRAQPAPSEGVRVELELEADREPIVGELSDISVEGLAVTLPTSLGKRLDDRLASVSRLRMRFALPGEDVAHECFGQIRRRSLLESGQRYGLTFEPEVDREMEARIQRFIARRRREDVGVPRVESAEATIQSRISRAMWLVAIGFIGLALITLLILGDRFAGADIASRLHSAELRLEQDLQSQLTELGQTARVIAGMEDLGLALREALIDHRELLRMVAESQRRIRDVDMVVVLDQHRSVLVNTSYPGTARQLWQAESRVWRAPDAFFLVAPATIRIGEEELGQVVLGRRIDSAFAMRVHDSTDADVLVLSREKMVAGAWAASVPQPVQPEEIRRLWGLGTSEDYHRVNLCGESTFASLIPLGDGISLVVSVLASDIMAIYWLLLLWLGGASVIVIALSLWLSRFIAGKLSRPIDELTQVSIELAEGNLDTSVSQSGPRELVVLAGTFNRMAERIQHLMADARRQARVVEEQRSKLELANAKDDFLVTVSHELLTPLTNILSSSEILSMMVEGEQVEREEFLGIIADQAEVLRKLITQFLDLANLRNGRGDWKEGEMDLAVVVRNAIDMARGRHPKAPALQPQVPDEPCVYVGDEERLCQALCHVVDNAIKFSPPDTTPEVLLSRSDDGYRITVTDLGQGVPETDREQVFEQFFQSGDVLTDRPSGAGIGLSICKEILDHHDGRITCSDNRPRGARFDLELPLRQAAAMPRAALSLI